MEAVADGGVMNHVAARLERDELIASQLLRQGKHASSSVDVDDDCHRGVVLLTWSTATVSDEGMKIYHVHAIRNSRALDGGDKRFFKKRQGERSSQEVWRRPRGAGSGKKVEAVDGKGIGCNNGRPHSSIWMSMKRRGGSFSIPFGTWRFHGLRESREGGGWNNAVRPSPV